MHYKVTRETSKKEFDEIIQEMNKNKSQKDISLSLKKKNVDWSKFCGVINISSDPVTLQRKWRDEWK